MTARGHVDYRRNPDGSKYKTRGGSNSWYARIRRPDGNWQTKGGFRRKLDAENWLNDELTKMRTGTWTDPALGRTLFRDWAAKVDAARLSRRQSTKDRDTSVMRNLVLPRFGDMRLDQIMAVHVSDWIVDLSGRGYAASTVTKAYQLCAGVLDQAVKKDLIGKSPCRDIDLPKGETSEKRFLTVAEIDSLAEAIHPRFRAMVLVGAYTGLRWGEMAALRVPDHLDMLRRTIKVELTLTRAHGKPEVGPVKTQASRRTVVMPAFLTEVLAAHIATFPAPDGLLFGSDEGTLLRQGNWRRRVWLPAVVASVGEPCRPHDLRHTHAALLIARGTHPKMIQARLGHASIRTTLDVYGHLFEGLDASAADTLDELWRSCDSEGVERASVPRFVAGEESSA